MKRISWCNVDLSITLPNNTIEGGSYRSYLRPARHSLSGQGNPLQIPAYLQFTAVLANFNCLTEGPVQLSGLHLVMGVLRGVNFVAWVMTCACDGFGDREGESTSLSQAEALWASS